MTLQFDRPKDTLPPLPNGMGWYASLADIRHIPDQSSLFFSINDMAVDGGFATICIAAVSERDAETRIRAYIEVNGGAATSLEGTYQVRTFDDLPADPKLVSYFDQKVFGQSVVVGSMSYYGEGTQ